MTIFRPEIAGLRAIAVAGVVLFHLQIGWAGGGFVGVDVFFIISGYLITRNILTDIERGSFTFGRFYARRTRRIFPALIVTVVGTYIVGALWCSPLMFLDLAKECTHALLSIANIQYWRESHQYFSPDSKDLGLLHFWSLSVEEQFYLVWPALIVVAAKLDRVFAFIVAAILCSLLASFVAARSDPSVVFFLTPFRIYEFGLGALVLFLERWSLGPGLKETLSAAGLVAIVGSAIFFRPDMINLEIAMLVPCLGACAIILGGSGTSAARCMTSPIFIRTGAISYSLYLCHWPIIFFARFIFGEEANSPVATLLMLAAMVVVAGVMFATVEQPFIRSPAYRTGSFRATALRFWPVILLLVAITHATFLSKGLPWRVPQAQDELARLQGFPDGRDMAPMPGPVVVALVGDSHAVQYDVGLSDLLNRLGKGMEILAAPGCPILEGVSLSTDRKRQGCIEMRDRALARLGQNDMPIVMDEFWSSYDDATIDDDLAEGEAKTSRAKGSYLKLESALARTMQQFVKNGRRVLLIGPQVDAACHFDRSRLYQGPLPHAPVQPCDPGLRADAEKAGAAMNAMLARVQARWPANVELLRPIDYLCGSTCPTMSDGIWLYFDLTHFSTAGSRYMVKRAELPLTKFLTGK